LSSPGRDTGLSSFLRVGYYWAEDREEVERWSAFVTSSDGKRSEERR